MKVDLSKPVRFTYSKDKILRVVDIDENICVIVYENGLGEKGYVNFNKSNIDENIENIPEKLEITRWALYHRGAKSVHMCYRTERAADEHVADNPDFVKVKLTGTAEV